MTERTESQWRHMSPATVCAGSSAQILFCITDAQRDIVSALDEITRLRAENAELREGLRGLLTECEDRPAYDGGRFGPTTLDMTGGKARRAVRLAKEALRPMMCGPLVGAGDGDTRVVLAQPLRKCPKCGVQAMAFCCNTPGCPTSGGAYCE